MSRPFQQPQLEQEGISPAPDREKEVESRYGHLKVKESSVGMSQYRSNPKNSIPKSQLGESQSRSSNLPEKLRVNTSIVSAEESEKTSLELVREKLGEYQLTKS